MPRQRAVDEWFEAYENPMKPVVQRIREVVLAFTHSGIPWQIAGLVRSAP